jgi:hypothetical protein
VDASLAAARAEAAAAKAAASAAEEARKAAETAAKALQEAAPFLQKVGLDFLLMTSHLLCLQMQYCTTDCSFHIRALLQLRGIKFVAWCNKGISPPVCFLIFWYPLIQKVLRCKH